MVMNVQMLNNDELANLMAVLASSRAESAAAKTLSVTEHC